MKNWKQDRVVTETSQHQIEVADMAKDLNDGNDKGTETNESVSNESNFERTPEGIFCIFGSISWLCSLISMGYSGFFWLKHGEWPYIPFYTVFRWLKIDPFLLVKYIEWLGIKKILLWFLELHITSGFLFLGVVFMGLFYMIEVGRQ